MARLLPPQLTELLRQTSRSFYRTLQILPIAVRPQISLAYLLARTADTIADTEIIPLDGRLQSLQRLRGRILGTQGGLLDFAELARHQSSPAERALLENCEASLAALGELCAADLQLVRNVLETITSGQELDLHRFHAASPENIIALQSEAELDDYTYLVAGCVGEFWTKICQVHLFPDVRLEESQSLADSIRFGKGLQLVNILRDLPADLRKGRCYLPGQKLREVGLEPGDLLRPQSQERFRDFYDGYLRVSESHLAAGWRYTSCLPWRQVRVRLACAWPILIGVETIKLLRTENVLDPQRRVKISRGKIRQLLWRSVLLYVWPSAWKGLVNVGRLSKGKPVASGTDLT